MKWVLSVLFFACVSFSQAAVPACKTGCSEHYCGTSCYTNEDNLLYTISTIGFGPNAGQAQCKASTGTCPSDVTGFDFETCQTACETDADGACRAYIKDQDVQGPRCRFLKKCMDMEEANVITPCNDCESERKCSSCPQFTYVPGSTVVHWVCEMQGDAYSRAPAEGTVCKPTASCETVEKPALIKCKANDQDPDALGSWVDPASGDAVVPDEQIVDAACECKDLRIPAAADTNLFCESEHTVDADGDYIIKSGDRCDLVCDAQLFIPIECRFNTEKTAASWHIEVDGDIDLGEDTICLACSKNNCEKSKNVSGTVRVHLLLLFLLVLLQLTIST